MKKAKKAKKAKEEVKGYKKGPDTIREPTVYRVIYQERGNLA